MAACVFQITPPMGLRAAPAEVMALISVDDIKGSYEIPYIQSNRELRVRVDFSAPGAVSANLRLEGPGFQAERKVEAGSPVAIFSELPPGEFRLAVEWRNADGTKVSETIYTRIGIGVVLAAIGDSLTEGYHGKGFMRENLDLKAANFPADAVSKDERNFPQFSPTTVVHKPSVNCFQSWMTSLNDGLSAAWKTPVFIANEGWGGFTSAAYLAAIRGDEGGWRDRVQLLKPTVWLIHLGVNDERNNVSPADFASNMRAIVDILIKDFQADPSQIYLANPSYDYAPGAEPLLRSYLVELDRMITELNLRKGPDFFDTFSKDRAKWYGADPVHPGVAGMELMAGLWVKALVAPAPKALSSPTSSFHRNPRDDGRERGLVCVQPSV
jgi:lysophospholipase L1-like esterase